MKPVIICLDGDGKWACSGVSGSCNHLLLQSLELNKECSRLIAQVQIISHNTSLPQKPLSYRCGGLLHFTKCLNNYENDLCSMFDNKIIDLSIH